MSLADIVNLIIDRQTTAVSRAGFGVPMFLGAHKVFNDRIRFYGSASALLSDGFDSTSSEYIAAAAAFAQSPSPVTIAIGRRTIDSAGVSVDTVVDATDYTLKINGNSYTHNSGAAATALTIAAGLHALINAGADPVTSTDDADGTLTLAADVAGEAWSLSVVGVNLSIEAYVPSDTIPNDLAAVKVVDDSWFALILHSHVQTDVEAAAAWIETERKLYATSSSDAEILNAASTTDVAYTLKASAYFRTLGIFHETPATYPEMAWLGRMLPTDPGSASWKFKTLAGVAVSNLTATQSKNAKDKNFNTYQAINGVSITSEGKTSGGEWIDIMRGIDWLHARMSERIYSRFVNLAKVPYTDAGVAVVEAEIRGQLAEGIAVGLLAADPAPVVTVPRVKDIASADKTARTLPDVTFSATLAGAIHAVNIAGTVSV